MLADILGEAPSAKLVERLFERSEGNPLYTEELLAAGLDGRGAAPQSLRDAFMLRIERLSPDAQAAARVIAAGRALDEPTIAEVSGIEPDALHVALREAVAEQVLVAGEPTRLSFRHALLREALYDDLLPGERSELHLALARAFEDRADYENDKGSSWRRRSPAITRPRETSRPRCAPRSRPRSRRARCTPTATPPTSPSARSSCGRASRTQTR